MAACDTLDPSEFEFSKFWEHHKLTSDLHDLEEKAKKLTKEVEEEIADAPEEQNTKRSWIKFVAKVASGILFLGSVGATRIPNAPLGENHMITSIGGSSQGIINLLPNQEARRNLDELGRERNLLQSKYRQDHTEQETVYLTTFEEITTKMATLQEQIEMEEVTREQNYERFQTSNLLLSTEPLLRHYPNQQDQLALLEVNEKLVSSISKTCCHLQNISQQIDWLQDDDNRILRRLCKKSLASLKESILGFDLKITDVKEFIIEKCPQLDAELGERVNCLMTYMSNSIFLIPRVFKELDLIIEAKSAPEIGKLRCAVDGILVLLQIDLRNYKTLSQDKVTDFGDMATRIIQSGDDLPQTSNNHPMI